MTESHTLDIVIPVYNEGSSILRCLGALKLHVRTPCRILICYDFDKDDTLPMLGDASLSGMSIVPVKNPSRGPHAAVRAGFAASTAPAVVMYPADDDYNADAIDRMVAEFQRGAEVVAASRFMRGGGGLEGCPFFKAVIVQVADFLLFHFARLPTHDATNGFRLFSRRVLQEIPITSEKGFTYSIELLVKAHRKGWRIVEVPVKWQERVDKPSRFKLIKWIPAYLVWFFYAFGTTWLGRRA